MDRVILTAARRAEHQDAVNAARAAKVKADIKTELEGLLQYREYTPVVIATVSEIANGVTSPPNIDVVVTLTGDTFKEAIAEVDLEINIGGTSLVFASVGKDTDTQITIGFTSTGATEGTLSIKVKASGLDSTPYLISNAISIDVPPGA